MSVDPLVETPRRKRSVSKNVNYAHDGTPADAADATSGKKSTGKTKGRPKKKKSKKGDEGEDDYYDEDEPKPKGKKNKGGFTPGLACRFALPALKMPDYQMSDVPRPSKELDDSVPATTTTTNKFSQFFPFSETLPLLVA